MLTTPVNQLGDLFQFTALDEGAELSPRFNIAPSQSIATVRNEHGDRALAVVRWGLVPAWAKDRHAGQGLMNACSETAALKPSFRDAFRQRRCLVLADGFYEWKRGSGKKKQPFAIRLKDGSPFAFAGLWERGEAADGRPLETCAILTTEANELVRPIHERMPVIMRPEDYEVWLDPQVGRSNLLQPLLSPFDAQRLAVFPVSSWVNDARHEGPRCLERVEPEPRLF